MPNSHGSKNSRKRKKTDSHSQNSSRSKSSAQQQNAGLPTIYILVQSHGELLFEANAQEPTWMDEDYLQENGINFFNKITYAPIGISNFENSDEAKLNESIKTLISEHHKEYSFALSGPMLIDKLRMIEIDSPEYLQRQFKKPKHHKSYVDAYLLNRNKDQLYQSAQFGIPIIEKSFSPDETRRHFDIYVAGIANSREGTLNSGLAVGDQLFNDPDKETREEFAKTFNLIKFDEEDSTEPISEITTSDLLLFAAFYDFKKVVVIDYSCEFCCPPSGCSIIPRNIVMDLRARKKRGEIGGKNKKYKKRKTVKRRKPVHV